MLITLAKIVMLHANIKFVLHNICKLKSSSVDRKQSPKVNGLYGIIFQKEFLIFEKNVKIKGKKSPFWRLRCEKWHIGSSNYTKSKFYPNLAPYVHFGRF